MRAAPRWTPAPASGARPAAGDGRDGSAPGGAWTGGRWPLSWPGALGPDADELSGLIHRLERRCTAAEELRFEEAALLRDEIAELRSLLTRDPVDGSPVLPGDSADITAEAEV